MMPSNIQVVEVGPRDGFQMESKFIPTDVKVAVVNALAEAGIRKIEVTSFVRPNVVPQLRDAREVMRQIKRVPTCSYVALVPNLQGARDALDARVNAVKVVIAVSESSNRRNVRMSVADSLNAAEAIFTLAAEHHTGAEAVISVAFGCPYEGELGDPALLTLTCSLHEIGYREISIADTVGVANPIQVKRLMTLLIHQFPDVHFSLHFHNTRGLALANILAGLEAGVDTYDSSIGGLGGCPIVPGGIGNASTEDLVYMLHEMGLATGISLEGVIKASRLAEDAVKHPLASYVLTYGTRQQLYRRMKAKGVSQEATSRHM